MRRTLALAALGLAAVPAAAQPPIITVGPNINVSRRNGNESETAVVISRTNPNLMAVASNFDGAGIFTAFSTNAGTSWTTGSTAGCCDAYLAADSFGNIYRTILTSSFSTQLQRSVNGGQSFTTVGTVGSGDTDHPELAVGPGPGGSGQSIWTRHTRSGVRMIGATSTALGNTSGVVESAALAGAGNFGTVAVGPNGQVAASYMATAGGQGPSLLPVFTNSTGAVNGTFTQVNNTISTNVGGFRTIPAQPNRDIDTQVQLQYDRSGGPRNGNLYMIYTQASNTTTPDTNIVVRRSTNNGATWSAEVRVNDDATTRSQFFSRLAIDQTTGNLAAVWFDARNFASNQQVELWGSVSTDGGVTWGTNFRISAGASDGRQSVTGDPNEFGDYIAADFHNGVLVASWPDNSNSTGNNPNGALNDLDIYFARITVAPIPEPGLVGLVAVAGLVGLRRWRGRAA